MCTLLCVCACACVCVRVPLCNVIGDNGVRACVCVCVCNVIGDNGRLQYLRFCLFEMYVNVVFVIGHLYGACSEFISC